MDENASNSVVLELTLKGGPPWGFRIKERSDNVIISKINCGGRAHKAGLKVNDEILVVNEFDVNTHPRTLARRVESDKTSQQEDEPQEEVDELPKLDYAYLLIRHSINKQLHLTVRRIHGNEPTQSCCYPHPDEEPHRRPSIQQNGITVQAHCREHGAHSQSEEEMLSPVEEIEQQERNLFQQYFQPQAQQQPPTQPQQIPPHQSQTLLGGVRAPQPLPSVQSNTSVQPPQPPSQPQSQPNAAGPNIRMRPLTYARVGGHLNGQINGQINGELNGQLNGHRLNGRLNGQLTGRINGELINGQLTGQLPLQTLPMTTIGKEDAVLGDLTNQSASMYGDHHTAGRVSQLLLAGGRGGGQVNESIRSDPMGQMRVMLERSRSALDRIDLRLPLSPECDSQSNEDYGFRSHRGHKDVWSPGSTNTSSSGRSSCDGHSSSTLQMGAMGTTPPATHPLFSGISLDELNMGHIGQVTLDEQHLMAMTATMRPYSAVGTLHNGSQSISVTPAPSFLQQVPTSATVSGPIIDQQTTELIGSCFGQQPRVSTLQPTPQQHQQQQQSQQQQQPPAPSFLQNQLRPQLLHPMQRDTYTPIFGGHPCSPGGLCSAPFSEEELSRPMPRSGMGNAAGYGISSNGQLGRSLPLLLDHNNNRLAVERMERLDRSEQTDQPSNFDGPNVVTILAAADSPPPPPLPPPPVEQQSPSSHSQPNSKPTSRRNSFHRPRPLSPSTFSESSSCTPAGQKKIGFRVGSPPPEMHFKCWTMPRNVHQQRLQRQQQHWQRLHFAELQQQRAQKAIATAFVAEQQMQRPVSARSRTPTMTTKTFAKRPMSQRQPPAKHRRSTNTSGPTGPQLTRPTSAFGRASEMMMALDGRADEEEEEDSALQSTRQQCLDRLEKLERLQRFWQTVAPPMLFSAQPRHLPTSYAKYLYETATHKYYTIPATGAQRGSILDLIPPSAGGPASGVATHADEHQQATSSSTLRRKRPALTKGRSCVQPAGDVGPQQRHDGAVIADKSDSISGTATLDQFGLSKSCDRKFGILAVDDERHDDKKRARSVMEEEEEAAETDDERLDRTTTQENEQGNEAESDDDEYEEDEESEEEEGEEEEEDDEETYRVEERMMGRQPEIKDELARESIGGDRLTAEHTFDTGKKEEEKKDGGSHVDRAAKQVAQKMTPSEPITASAGDDVGLPVQPFGKDDEEDEKENRRQNVADASSQVRKPGVGVGPTAATLVARARKRGKPVVCGSGGGDGGGGVGVGPRRKSKSRQMEPTVSKTTTTGSAAKGSSKRASTVSKTSTKSNSIRQRLKMAKRTIDNSSFLTPEEKQRLQRATIEHYTPGRSSISVREKQKFYADLINYIDNIFTQVMSSSSADASAASSAPVSSDEEIDKGPHRLDKKPSADCRSRSQQDTFAASRLRKEQKMKQKLAKQTHSIFNPECAFHLLVGGDAVGASTSSTNGYDSDSSYVIRRREQIPAPVSRSTYADVQRGGEIPINGLQRAASGSRPLRDSPHQYKDDEINIHYCSVASTLQDFSATKSQQMQRFLTDDFEKKSLSTAMNKHQYSPMHGPIIPLDRYRRAYTSKSKEELANSLLARVMFDFHALSSKEISIKKHDIVIVKRAINHNWVEIEDPESGLKGHVPRNHLDYEQRGMARAKFDFQAKTNIELNFKRGEILSLIRKVDKNWFEGTNSKGEAGIIPCNYVETLRMPLYLHDRLPVPVEPPTTNAAGHHTPESPTFHHHHLSPHPQQQQVYPRSAVTTPGPTFGQFQLKSIVSQPNLSTAVATNSMPAMSSQQQQRQQQQQPIPAYLFTGHTAAAFHPHLHPHHHQHQTLHPPAPSRPPPTLSAETNGIVASEIVVPPSSFGPVTTTPTVTTITTATGTTITGYLLHMPKYYRVLYPYRPQRKDELELLEGDVVIVSMHCQDGWFVGHSRTTGQSGSFPGNYVEELS